ncbi:MAG: phosphoribosylglycinamide formyltransferase [Deltaproteobacteria bacterium]|nr:phosphoribosylglycinamide formyltransferase [Deltaproteobacteria bacterium]
MKVGVLVSGNGTNLQALIDAQARGDLSPGEIAVVISNNPMAPALARAIAAKLPAVAVDHRGLERQVFEERVLASLDAHGVEAVVLAGFMRVLTPHFIERYPLRIVNTHPSLLPAFPGKDAIAQALAHGAKITGVTIHFVDTSLDGGPIIAQESVPIVEDDDAATIQGRVQHLEHRMLPVVVRRLAAGKLSCQGRIVRRAE